jgi:hypothetical protein
MVSSEIKGARDRVRSGFGDCQRFRGVGDGWGRDGRGAMAEDAK